MLGAYRPGRSSLHRASAGAKLLGLFVLSLVSAVLASPATSVGLLVLALLLLVVARARVGTVLRTVRGLLVVMALLAAYQVWQQGWERAVTVVGALVALFLLAIVLTTTTPVAEMIDTISRAARPLRPLGVNPEVVGLAFSLLLRGIPTTWEIASETRQAARARGLERDPRALLTPMVIRVVAHARATGEALHARGVGDDLERAGRRSGPG
ncbi:MAG: cobalt transport protein [Nocardioides sp.]|nr:cobalt transport protein [Nocardioides sp.]